MQLSRRMSRLGTESAFDVLSRAKELEAQGHSIINLGIGQPDFLTPDNIVEAGRKALADGHHGYTPANGTLALREAVVEDISRRHSVGVDPNSVVIVPGGKVTIFFAALMFGEAGTEILYPNPGFPIYQSAIEFSGATAVPMPLYENTGFSFNAKEVLSKITNKTTLIILNSPANPTGGVTPKKELDALVKGLMRHPNVAILSDEIYSSLLYDNEDHVSMLQYPEIKDRVIILDGWSKTYAMTGWRIGYGIWPSNFSEKAERLAINCNSCVNAVTQVAALEALTGPQASVDKMRAAFDKRRKTMVAELNAIPGFRCPMPQGAFYTMPNIEATGFGVADLQNRLLEEAGVACIAGTSFGKCGEGYLRFSYAASTTQIVEAMGRIRTFLANSV